MSRQFHNHIPQTKPQLREEEVQSTYRHATAGKHTNLE